MYHIHGLIFPIRKEQLYPQRKLPPPIPCEVEWWACDIDHIVRAVRGVQVEADTGDKGRDVRSLMVLGEVSISIGEGRRRYRRRETYVGRIDDIHHPFVGKIEKVGITFF